MTGLNDLYLKTQEEMRHNQFESTHFYPSLRGKEIDRYYLRPIEEFLFYPYQQENHRTVPVAEATLRKQCPNYLNYLRANLGVINSRGYFVNSSKRWYELWNQRDISVVRSPKIVTPELSEKNRFMVAQPDVLYGDTVCGIVLQDEYAERIDLKYLLCELNSSLIEWFFKRTTVPKAGGFFIYKVMFLKNVPVKTPPRHAQVPFTQLAERIIRTKAAEPAADVSALEREIDQLVYRLYGLTPEEIAIVEGASP